MLVFDQTFRKCRQLYKEKLVDFSGDLDVRLDLGIFSKDLLSL